MRGDGLRAEFIGEAGSRLFVLLRAPANSVGDCTLVVPPFAEEMNKCRRVVSDLARRECETGRGVLCVDLFGTGDSDGDFRDARVGRWVEDLWAAAAWSAAQGWQVTSVLGIRLGAILAMLWTRKCKTQLAEILFWQPVMSGARHMDHFLRLRAMASRMESGRPESIAELRSTLKSGGNLEVAGYTLSGSLYADIEALDLLAAVPMALPPIRWFDVISDAGLSIAPATQRTIDQLRQRGYRIDHQRVPGEPFWASTEIVTNPALIAAS